MLPVNTRTARNIGKDANRAMARTPGNTGKDADALLVSPRYKRASSDGYVSTFQGVGNWPGCAA